MLAYVVEGMDKHIAACISKTMGEGACAVLFHIRCFLSDRFCGPVLDLLASRRNDDISEWFPDSARMTARIRDLTAFHIMGSRAACDELKKKLDENNPDGYSSMKEAMQDNESLNKRFKK